MGFLILKYRLKYLDSRFHFHHSFESNIMARVIGFKSISIANIRCAQFVDSKLNNKDVFA